MMEAVFLKILNMSITASWIVLAVMVVRLLLKKAPKWISVLLWGLVGIRLVCPISLESAFSLIPSAEPVPSNILHTSTPVIHSGITVVNDLVNPIISESLAPAVDTGVNPMQTITWIASIIWLVGMAAMLLYTAVSYLRIRRSVREAIPSQENIWLCDHVDTPFILGVIRPRIFLPSAMQEQDQKYVIAHEQAHLKRHDHWWKPLGFLLLTVYWFNPLLWIAYILLCRDIELACDEKVIREMGAENKKSYSNALINCSVPRKMIAACPLAFGEGSVKGRVKSVLNYKKPGLWIVIAAVISCVAVAVCFLPNPIQANEEPSKLIFDPAHGSTTSNADGDGVFIMSAAEVNEKGVVLRRCEITLEITKKSSEKDTAGTKYTSYECTVNFFDIYAPFMTHKLTCYRYDIAPAWLFSGPGYVPGDNLMETIVLYMDEEQENCLIEIEHKRYFVASTDPDFDPAAVYKSLSKELSKRITYG